MSNGCPGLGKVHVCVCVVLHCLLVVELKCGSWLSRYLQQLDVSANPAVAGASGRTQLLERLIAWPLQPRNFDERRTGKLQRGPQVVCSTLTVQHVMSRPLHHSMAHCAQAQVSKWLRPCRTSCATKGSDCTAPWALSHAARVEWKGACMWCQAAVYGIDGGA